MCVHSEGDKDYLTLGITNPAPTQLFVECFLHLNVPFLRLTNFGQKEKTDKFITFNHEIQRAQHREAATPITIETYPS